MRKVVATGLVVLIAVLLFGALGYFYFENYGKSRCEACGMIISAESDVNYRIIDTSTDLRVWACCSGCMLRVVAAHPNLGIEALDSWWGESAPKISISVVNGNVSSVSPGTTLIVLGSKITNSCVSNRIALNQTSAELLVADGYNSNNPLSPFKTSVPANAPLLTVQQALVPLKAKGITYSGPSALPLYGIATAGVIVLVTSIVAWKKLAHVSTERK
jgi:hypothetical protein